MPSLSRNFGIAVLAMLSLLGLVLFSSSPLQAQDDETSKYDLFVGYQWLHPGGTVPIPGSQASPARLRDTRYAEGLWRQLDLQLQSELWI